MFPGSINKIKLNKVELSKTNNTPIFTNTNNNSDLNETHEFNTYMNNIPNNINNKYYNYNILNLLETTTNLNIDPDTVIHICAYRVITTELYPLLMYLLYKDPKNDLFVFPNFKYNNSINPLLYAETILYGLLNCNQLIINGDNPDSLINYDLTFKGFLHENNELFLFFDSTNCENNLYDIYKKTKIWYALIDEIINHRHICNLQIDNSVTDFFINHIDFIYLKDKNNVNYEIPVVAYSGQPEHKLNFTYVFGVTKKTKNAFMGPYYYFTDYKNSIKECGWSLTNKPEFKDNKLITENEYGKYIKTGGIVRFAIFLGINKIILNDNLDKSIETCYESSHINDYEGKWTEHNDSVYIGKLKLSNDTHNKHYPYWVLKTYEQQVPLSYHFINKTTLGETFQENDKYLIM